MHTFDTNGTGVSSRDLLTVLFRRKWGMAFVCLTGVFATVIWLWVLRDDTYALTAKVLVRIGYEQAPSNTILSDRPLNVVSYRAQDVNSEIDILQNTELLGRVVDRLELYRASPPPPYPDGFLARTRWRAKSIATRAKQFVDESMIWAGLRPRLTEREKVLAALKAGLTVAPQKESNVFVAHLLVNVREHSSIILNTLLDEYLAFRLKLWKGDGTVAFFQSQAAESERQLHDAEEALSRFESQSGITLLNRQQDVLLVTASDAERVMHEAELALADANGKWMRLERALATDDPSFAVSGEFATGSFPEHLMVQLSSLQRERERMRMTELDEGVRLQNLKSQTAVTLAQIRDYVRSVVAEKQAAYDTRAAVVSTLKARLRSLHGEEADSTALKRRVKVLEDQYLMYRSRLNEATGVEALEAQRIGNVVVAEWATDPLAPAGVRKLTLLLIALCISLWAAIAWVVVAEFFDHGIYTAATLQNHVGAPVLAVVPTAQSARLREMVGRRVPARAASGAPGSLFLN
jgi:uncharacterized protein involved in exopolysaccharide biosynthesis